MADHDFSGVFTLYLENQWLIKKKESGSFLLTTAVTNLGRATKAITLYSTFERAMESIRRTNREKTHEAVSFKTAEDLAVVLQQVVKEQCVYAAIDPGYPDAKTHAIKTILDGIHNRPK